MGSLIIRSIAHPTDLSPEGASAFEHALRLALVNRCQLEVLHVRDPDERAEWDSFPRVREVLQRWGYVQPDARVEDIFRETGVTVNKVDIRDGDAVDGLARYLTTHHADLLVLASHGRAGFDLMLNNSVSVQMAQATMVPSLIFGPAARPFVDSRTGSLDPIRTVLVPVDHEPSPADAIRRLDALVQGLDVAFDYIHVGEQAPVLPGRRTVRSVSGPIVETLLEEARNAQLIAMPMVGRRGLADALRGSTTERVVREVTCPILAIPVIS